MAIVFLLVVVPISLTASASVVWPNQVQSTNSLKNGFAQEYSVTINNPGNQNMILTEITVEMNWSSGQKTYTVFNGSSTIAPGQSQTFNYALPVPNIAVGKYNTTTTIWAKGPSDLVTSTRIYHGQVTVTSAELSIIEQLGLLVLAVALTTTIILAWWFSEKKKRAKKNKSKIDQPKTDMNCPNCGDPMPSNSTTCPNCGMERLGGP